MTFVLGVDPGISGALAVYDTVSRRIIHMSDMPHWYMTVGKKKRKRVDGIGLRDLFAFYGILGVELAVLEAVGARPMQSQVAGMVLGYTAGLIYMACVYCKIPIETVPAKTWKGVMNVPGKVKGSDDDIMHRTTELFPEDVKMFKGPKGGKKIDRCEAAMLARFGGDHVLRTTGLVPTDAELDLVYRQAQTGA